MALTQEQLQAIYEEAGRMSIDELLTFRDRYHAEYLEEIKKARIKNKQRSGNTIEVKF